MDSELFQKFINLIESITGLSSPESNHAQVRRSIRLHASITGLSIQSLLSKMQSDPALQEQFLNDVLIGETYFFREKVHFDILRKEILPGLPADHTQLNLWSASCSTGEEAVSLAVLTDDTFNSHRTVDFRVHATDINSKALSRLSEGVYPYTSLRQDGHRYHKLILNRYTVDRGDHTFTMDPKILSKIRSRRVNLFADSPDLMPDRLDIIFFRNTLLYFPEAHRVLLIDRLVSRLSPGGYLFLSSSEVPFVRHPELMIREFDGHYVLRKRELLRTAEIPGGSVEGSMDSAGSRVPEVSELPETSGESLSVETPLQLGAYDPEEVLRILNGKDSVEEPPQSSFNELHRQAAEDIGNFFDEINRNNHEEAEKLLEIILSEFPHSALSQYCTAWYYYTSGNHEQALPEFHKAVQIDSLFWPARFYYALLLAGHPPDCLSAGTSGRSEAPSAAAEFRQCAHDIEEVRKLEKNRFAFLLSEFNDSYFLHMCERWIEKLSGGM